MMREEAIRWLEETIQDSDTYWESCSEALQKELDEQKEVFLMALSALRPVSREQVEKVWRREWRWVGEDRWSDTYECSKCGKLSMNDYPFCPNCNSAMNDEAVEMVMERLEALHSETKTD